VSTRFYSPDPAQNGKLRLGSDEARHLSRVCRLGAGDVVEVFDGKGHATRAEIVRIDQQGVELTVIGRPLADALPPFPLILASAVPKGDRFDWLVEKATELGVERLIPILTERSVVEPGGAKLERLRRAIVEASKQCGRNRLMILETPVRWDQLSGLHSDSLRFLADPEGIRTPHWPAIPPDRSVILAVGPEGGFTPSERTRADQTGWLAIRLSATILRIETAGLVGCADLFSHGNDLQERPSSPKSENPQAVH
jgi:16S rRNA (uracil1498-N3)-methyltransferase